MDQAGSVDPEVQASISNLVSALGGYDSSLQRYKLGDEALACLRDIRKWLQNYDAKYDRLEVACAIANTTLVTSDIPQILGAWETSLRKNNDAYLDRVALGCLELVVPLTWPHDLVGKEASAQHFSQSMFLKKVQTNYKKALLSHSSHGVLRATIRLATTALRVPHRDREPRDEGILTLVMSFFRNLLSIDTGDDEDRANTVNEFERQKVLGFLITLGAGMGTGLDAHFDVQDTLLMECLYLMLRGIDIDKLFGQHARDEPMADPFSQNLKQLLETEDELNRGAFKPSRHSRFGTMIAMEEGDGNRVSISGQRGVSGSMEATLTKLDESKKWHKPRVRQVADEREKTSYMPATAAINADTEAMKLVNCFVCDFLDSSFNPLFVKIRKLIERQQSPRVATIPPLVHYCYLTGFFIDAERTRKQADAKPMDYRLVGASLSKSAFNIVMNLLRRGMEPGELRSTDLVHAAMVSFRQVMLTIRDMSYINDNFELRDAAESMKSRLFYEESWLNMLSQLPKSAHRKSLAYACETIAVTHITLKMLDEYAKQHTIMFVRMKRGQAKKPKPGNGNSDDEEENSRNESIRVTNERKFSYEKFVLKYINGPTIDTYERVLTSFREISEGTLLNIFSFFRRTFAKTRCRAIFYRISLMRLLLDLVGHRGIPQESKARKVADQFLKYYVSKFVETAEQMPSLHIQINESITPADAFYYDHGGKDKEKFKPPKYEFALSSKAKRDFSSEKQMAILVAALIDIGKDTTVKWVEDTLTAFVNNKDDRPQRQQPLTMDKDRIKSVHNDALLRLFLRTLGLVVNTTIGQIMIPPTLDELALIDQLQWISKYQNEPVEFENGKVAMDFIKIEGDHDRDESDDEYQDEHQEGDQEQEGEEESIFVSNSNKRHHADAFGSTSSTSKRNLSTSNPTNDTQNAFALDPSDDDNDDQLTQSIAAIRRRVAIDDEDD